MRAGCAVWDDRRGPALGRSRHAWIPRVAIAAVALTGCWGENQGRAEGPPSSAASTTVVVVQSSAPPRSGASTTTRPPIPETSPTTRASPATPTVQASFAVRSVIDGDTLTLVDGRQVRLAQVDAPETNECFGSQSTRGLRALVDGRNITLRRPSNGPEKDRYGRTLAEVSVGDRSVNEQLVRDGAAEWYEEFAGEDADLAQRLRSSEREARVAGRGVWSACGLRVPVDTPPPTQPVMASRGSCHPAYPDDCIAPPPPDLDCPQIQRKVRVDHSYGDPHRLDANKDGWGCEGYG